MGLILKSIISAGVFFLVEQGLGKLVGQESGVIGEAAALEKSINALSASSGITNDEARSTHTALIYEKVEAQGTNPQDFWAGLSQSEKDQLKFSPESLLQSMNRTKFLGYASYVLFAAGAAASLFYLKNTISGKLPKIKKTKENLDLFDFKQNTSGNLQRSSNLFSRKFLKIGLSFVVDLHKIN